MFNVVVIEAGKNMYTAIDGATRHTVTVVSDRHLTASEVEAFRRSPLSFLDEPLTYVDGDEVA